MNRDPWTPSQYQDRHNGESQKKRGQKTGAERISEITAGNFLYLMENINLHIEEAQRTSSTIVQKD